MDRNSFFIHHLLYDRVVALMLAYVSDPRCLLHADNACEVSARWSIIDEVLASRTKWRQLLIDNVEDSTNLFSALCRVHTPEYVRSVNKQCQILSFVSTSDVDVSPGSWPASLTAVASVLCAVDALAENVSADAPSFVFCNVRPPGHHAGCRKASGFCLFNNVVVGARYALDKHPLAYRHVAIVDIDVHPGDQTVAILHENRWSDQISYYSIHQRHIFPNVSPFNDSKNDCDRVYLRALDAGCTWEEYEETLDELLGILAKTHKPDLVIISCGFDSCMEDRMGDFPLLPAHYGQITRKIHSVCPNIVSVLEGGYHLSSLAQCVTTHLDAAQCTP